MFLNGDVVVEMCFIPGVVGVVVGRGVVGGTKRKKDKRIHVLNKCKEDLRSY